MNQFSWIFEHNIMIHFTISICIPNFISIGSTKSNILKVSPLKMTLISYLKLILRISIKFCHKRDFKGPFFRELYGIHGWQQCTKLESKYIFWRCMIIHVKLQNTYAYIMRIFLLNCHSSYPTNKHSTLFLIRSFTSWLLPVKCILYARVILERYMFHNSFETKQHIFLQLNTIDFAQCLDCFSVGHKPDP